MTKGCSEKSKTIARDRIEGEFAALLRQLAPSPGLIKTASTMFKTIRDHRVQYQNAHKQGLKSQITKAQGKIDQLLDRILEAELPGVVNAYETKIKRLEQDKLRMAEKIARCATPRRPFTASLRNRSGVPRKPLFSMDFRTI